MLAIFPLPCVVRVVAVLIQAAVHSGAKGRCPMPISSHLGLSFLVDFLLALEPLAVSTLVVCLLSNSGEQATELSASTVQIPDRTLRQGFRCSCSGS